MKIFELLKKKFSKEQAPQNNAPVQNNVMNEEAVPGNQTNIAVLAKKAEEAENKENEKLPPSESEKSQTEAKSSVSTGSSLDEMYRELKNRKGGVLNMSSKGRLYTAAISALGKVNQTITKRFTASAADNFKLLNELDKHYLELIRAASGYTSYKHLSPEGEIRNEVMKQVLDRARRDSTALSAIRTDFCSLSPEEQQTKSIPELLRQARAVRITVKDYRKLMKEREKKGQASEVLNLNKDNADAVELDGTSSPLGDTYFFKPEDEIDMFYTRTAAKIMENIMARYPKLTPDDKEEIWDWVSGFEDYNSYLNFDEDNKDRLDRLSDEGKLAMRHIYDNRDGAATTLNQFSKIMGFKDNEKVNMTRRNVATSRVAALLGLSDLVAESQTAEIYDEATENTLRGNIMKKTRCKEATVDAINKNKANTGQLMVSVTGGFQRDITNLQVLDVICGQLDRHNGNYFVDVDNCGNFCGIQGIDNDASFGRNEQQSLAGRPEAGARAVYDDNNEMCIPYMDKNLADRIVQLNPQVLEYTLQDLLKPDEIKAAKTRLTRVKEAILKQREKDPSRLLEDDQWNDDTAQEMLNDYWTKAGVANNYTPTKFKENLDKEWLQRNYLGDLLTSGIYIPKKGIGDIPKIQKLKKKIMK